MDNDNGLEEFLADCDAMDAAFRRDVLRRAEAAGVEPDQFDNLIQCDLYLQSLGK